MLTVFLGLHNPPDAGVTTDSFFRVLDFGVLEKDFV